MSQQRNTDHRSKTVKNVSKPNILLPSIELQLNNNYDGSEFSI